MSAAVAETNERLSRGDGWFWATVQYGYFMRVALLLPLTLTLLAALDAFTDASALTRGIFTPPVEYAFGAAEFFVISLGMVSLLTARIVCINGQSRFLTRPPDWLQRALGTRSEEWAWRTLICFQLPGLFVIGCYHYNAHREHEVMSLLPEIGWSALGIGLAAFFWWVINNLYYWSSCIQPQPKKAATLLWPQHHPLPPSGMPLEIPFALKPLLAIFRFIAARGEGYSPDGTTLFEGHQLAAIGALGYFTAYLVLAPITAPTQQTFYTTIDFVLLAVVVGLIAWSIAKVSRSRKHRSLAGTLLICILALVACIALVFAVLSQRWATFANWIWFEHFPVIVAVTVLLTSFTFLITGIAFWADRHRIPVITLSVVFISALQFVVHTGAGVSGEHTFQVLETPAKVQAVKPIDAYKYYRKTVCGGQATCPLIIVTASGGGIHAAAWTATVMTELEKQFAATNPNFLFHNHILLISSVSGGSVGTLPFLREYYAKKPFDETASPKCDPAKKEGCPDPYWSGQVRRAAFCSSLGGVGWGLEYGDLLRLLAPEMPYINHLTDRSQALEETLRRNLTDKSCDPTYGDDRFHSDDRFGKDDGVDKLTLVQMMGDLIGVDPRRPRVPAFAFNSTVDETGDRFLFSNYENGAYAYATHGVAPGDSWLSEYYELASSHPDLSLVTAARLSATFPYVSSAARAEGLTPNQAQHFIDGGYFDNDGTSSAIEFLEQLFPPPSPDDHRPDPASLPVVPILFIEIRDGIDLPIESDDDLKWGTLQQAKDSWTPASQTIAPVLGFWNAGHSSITLRNRRELQLLLESLGNRHKAGDNMSAEVTHIVFDYVEPKVLKKMDADSASQNQNAKQPPAHQEDKEKRPLDHEAAQPLSWHLTKSQESALGDSFMHLAPCSTRAVDWAKTASKESGEAGNAGEANKKTGNTGKENKEPDGPRSIEVQCDQRMSKDLGYRERKLSPG